MFGDITQVRQRRAGFARYDCATSLTSGCCLPLSSNSTLIGIRGEARPFSLLGKEESGSACSSSRTIVRASAYGAGCD